MTYAEDIANVAIATMERGLINLFDSEPRTKEGEHAIKYASSLIVDNMIRDGWMKYAVSVDKSRWDLQLRFEGEFEDGEKFIRHTACASVDAWFVRRRDTERVLGEVAVGLCVDILGFAVWAERKICEKFVRTDIQSGVFDEVMKRVPSPTQYHVSWSRVKNV